MGNWDHPGPLFRRLLAFVLEVECCSGISILWGAIMKQNYPRNWTMKWISCSLPAAYTIPFHSSKFATLCSETRTRTRSPAIPAIPAIPEHSHGRTSPLNLYLRNSSSINQAWPCGQPQPHRTQPNQASHIMIIQENIRCISASYSAPCIHSPLAPRWVTDACRLSFVMIINII